MSDKPEESEAIAEAAVPLFDVVVSMPAGARLEDIERLASEVAGLPPERIEKLLSVLRSVPQAKIGSGVTRERADKARDQFTKAGLTVTINPVLTIQSMVTGSFDGKYTCPACKARVVLPESRQCPNCGVFVDKVTEEALLRRKLMEQEQRKLDFQAARDAKEAEEKTRRALEAALREKIREELEAKYGLGKKQGIFGGKAGAFRLVTLVALVAAAFVGGKGVTGTGWSWSQVTGSKGDDAVKSAKGSGEKDVDKMLESLGDKNVEGSAGPSDGSAGASGDPDIDDPLIQAAGGKRIGAKGLSVEQAVAAAQTLAKSVGNTTAERALAGGSVSGTSGNASGAGTAPGAIAGTGSAAATAGGRSSGSGDSGTATTTAIPNTVKIRLLLDFAQQLAEMGQIPRALSVVKAAKAIPGASDTPDGNAAIQVAEMVIKASALRAPAGGNARLIAEDLMKQASSLADPADRARALSRVGVTLSRNERISTDAARAFMTAAADSVKAIVSPPIRTAAASEWAVSLGEVLLSEALLKAKTGSWTKVQSISEQLEALVRQAPDANAQAKLYAIDSQLKQQLGQPDKSTHSMAAGLAIANKLSDLVERAAMIRSMVKLSAGAGQEQMEAAQSSLQSQAISKSGLERAQTLAELSLLNAELGLRSKSSELGQLSQATSGLTPEDSARVTANLIVRTDLANAKVLHGIGLYSDAEAALRRVADYLL
ncbi:MAG: hypothetical protein KF686_10215 [Ramlibacter sp.]|nr:hypothetical protein [Ramlibacter sp.]